MTRLVWAGLVDPLGEVRELQIPSDAAPEARAQGWLVLDDATCPAPVPVRSQPDATGYSSPEDDDDDGA